MALIDKASLLMVPSTYEAGKLYNVLPSGNRAPDSTDQNSGYDQTRADFDFDRGSNAAATRVNASGLIEKYRENLLTYSNDFSNAAWEKSDVTITSGFEGYDGTNNAWELTRTATAYARMNQAVTQSGVYAHSIYAKAGTLNWISIGPSGGGEGTWFNLSNGTIGIEGNLIKHSSIESVGNGWYRISVVVNSPVNQWFRFYPSDVDGGDESATATGTIYIQSAQLESGLVASSYLESTSVTGKAGVLVDLPRINYDANGENGALLLEPSRVNIIKQSEYYEGSDWSSQQTLETLENVTNPEGTNTTYKVCANASNSNHYLERAPYTGATSGVDYVFSFFAKAEDSDFVQVATSTGFAAKYQNFNLSNGTFGNGDANAFGYTSTIEAVGTNGWYRISVKATTTSTSARFLIIPILSDVSVRNPIFLGDGSSGFYMWGAQLEQASYVSSYIPTMGTSETRAADSCNNGGSAESINSTEGVLYAEISALADDGTYRIFSINDGTRNERVYVQYTNASNTIAVVVKNGNVTQANISHSLTDETQNTKVAFRYKANDFAFYINGSQIGTDTSGSTPVGLNNFSFDQGNGANYFYGNVKQVAVFNEALTNAELATLTTL